MACSGSLAACFVNNDYVTAEIIYSTAHVHHKELAWTGATVSSRKEVVCRYVVLCYVCCSSCCASQERINVSVVPKAPGIFFRPLSLCLVHPGFGKQCEQ